MVDESLLGESRWLSYLHDGKDLVIVKFSSGVECYSLADEKFTFDYIENISVGNGSFNYRCIRSSKIEYEGRYYYYKLISIDI